MTAPDQTPRTDFVAFQLIWRNGAYYVSVPNIPSMDIVGADFARQLERENAALVAAASEALDWMVKAGYDDGAAGHMLRAALALARQS